VDVRVKGRESQGGLDGEEDGGKVLRAYFEGLEVDWEGTLGFGWREGGAEC